MEQDEQQGKTLAEYFEIIIRRRNVLIVSFLIVGFLGSVLAIKLPPVYRSSATILIEDQQIPQSMVATTITDFADKRIQLIKQRVMTRDRILSIIQKHKVYLEERKKLVPSELVARFQEDALINMISANVRGQHGGGKATIAFSISFVDKNPVLAQAVANELVSLFLNENTRVRSQRAAKTTNFLFDEAEKLKGEIEGFETKIVEFKAENGKSLPEMKQNNILSLERSKEAIRQADIDVRLARDRLIYLTDSLLRVEDEVTSTQTYQPLSKSAQLRSLKAQYIHFGSLYTEKHPDTQRVKRQIQTMEPGFTGEVTGDDAENELKQAKGELELLKKKYSPNHPDVVKQQQRVGKLAQKLDENKKQDKDSEQDDYQESALYVSITGQLRSTQHQIDYLLERKIELQENIQVLQDNIDKAPLVEKEYIDLNRMRQTSLNKYTELEAKYRAAKLAQTMEEEQKGEAFTLIEPPVAPDKPEKPNRKKIAVMGFAAGIGVGLGLTILLELMNEVIRGPKSLERLTGMQAIVVIPYIENPLDRALRSRRFKMVLIALVVIFIVIIAGIHFFVKPLEMIWAIIMMKVGRL